VRSHGFDHQSLGLLTRVTSGNCVEVARNIPGIVAVRDSKDPHGPVLTLGAGVWRGFVDDVKAGRH
jgi:hypothetical protein